MDIGMPGVDGYQAAKAIRELLKDRRLVIIALSGWGRNEDRRRSEEAGFDAHMTKPLAFDALANTMARLSG